MVPERMRTLPFWQGFVRRLRRPRPDEIVPPTKERVAFVLLGGGAHGAAQAGAFATLLLGGVIPEFLVGISAGAWNSAFWCIDPTIERARALERIWESTTSNDILGTIRWRTAISAVTNRGTLFDQDGLHRLAERHLGPLLTFEDLRVPLKILAVNISAGEPVILEHGPLLRAVLASAAIPGVFPPVTIENNLYVDGGLADWTACEAALEAGATKIYLISCGVVNGTPPRLETLTGLLERSMEVAGSFKFRWLAQSLRNAGAEVIAIQPEIAYTSPLNFNHGAQLVESGRVAGQKALAVSST